MVALNENEMFADATLSHFQLYLIFCEQDF